MERFKGTFYLFCAFSLAGTSVVAARFVTGRLGTFTISAAGLFFALLCLLPLSRDELMNTVRLLTGRDWLMLFLQALCGIFLFRLFLLQGLLRTSAGEAGILTGATPAATALLARILLQEPVNLKSLMGILCTVGGILLIEGIFLPGREISISHFWGNLLVLGAALSESLFNIFSRFNNLRMASARRQPYPPIVQTTLVAGIAFLLCLPPSSQEHPVVSLVALGLPGWLALAWYGAFVTALAFIFWYAGIKRCTAYAAAAFSGMMPLTALILSAAVLGEKAGWQQWSGGILVILGMFLIGGRADNHQPAKLLTQSNTEQVS